MTHLVFPSRIINAQRHNVLQKPCHRDTREKDLIRPDIPLTCAPLDKSLNMREQKCVWTRSPPEPPVASIVCPFTCISVGIILALVTELDNWSFPAGLTTAQLTLVVRARLASSAAAALTAIRSLWSTQHPAEHRHFNISVLADQQTAGAFMWCRSRSSMSFRRSS
jgi:hypothetical protein